MSHSMSAPDYPVQLSVIDRLLSKNLDDSVTRKKSEDTFKESVRRDLEWLLNTRQNPEVDPSYDLAAKSVYAYGLPDFSYLSLGSSQDQVKLLRAVQDAIKAFEPRLSGVRVIPIQDEGISTGAFHFRIEAILSMDPAPEQISFVTDLELSTDKYTVKEV